MNKFEELYDHSIEYDYSHLPQKLIDIIHLLEKYEETGKWEMYDGEYEYLESQAKSALVRNIISEYDYKMIERKYGGYI